MAKKCEKIGEMRFCLDDWREDELNESVDTTFALYGSENGEIMSIEHYHMFCRLFAATMGFSEKTIEEWFGGY